MKEISKHRFVFNKEDNGGEALTLETVFYAHSDKTGKLEAQFFTNQKLTLNSYCNAASFELIGAQLTSKELRKLADELDKLSEEVVKKINEYNSER